MAQPLQLHHSFDHSGGQYTINVALVADAPAIYAIEVTRKGKGGVRESLITLTVRSDHDHAFVESAIVLEKAFQQGEKLVRSLYL